MTKRNEKLLFTQLGGLLGMVVAYGLFHYGFMIDNWSWVHSGFIGVVIGCAFVVRYFGLIGLFGFIPSLSVITIVIAMSDVAPWWEIAIGLIAIQTVATLYFRWQASKNIDHDDLDKYERQFHV